MGMHADWIALSVNVAVTLVTVGVLYGRLSTALSGIAQELQGVERLFGSKVNALEATMEERRSNLELALAQNTAAHSTIHKRLDDVNTRLTRVETKMER